MVNNGLVESQNVCIGLCCQDNSKIKRAALQWAILGEKAFIKLDESIVSKSHAYSNSTHEWRAPEQVACASK